MEKTELPLVSFEQAQELKKAGFDWEASASFELDGEDNYGTECNWNQQSNLYSRPTVALALMYLREVKGFYCYPDRGNAESWYYAIREVSTKAIIFVSHMNSFGSYALAESAALTHILNILNQEK